MNSSILYQAAGGIAMITLNEPDNLNAMNEPMGRDFGRILTDIDRDKSVRVAVLTGAGRAFSSGGNLDMIEAKTNKSKVTNKRELKNFYKLFLKVRELRVPVIAAINGPAVGAGFCLALACDLRYAAESAKLGANFARLGLAPGMGGTFLVTRLAGSARASEILLFGEVMAARKAYEMGILNDVYASDELMAKVNEKAALIAANAPLPVAMIKKGIQKALDATLTRMFDYDAAAQAACFASEDIKEGIRAIREKRAPVFEGK